MMFDLVTLSVDCQRDQRTHAAMGMRGVAEALLRLGEFTS